MLFGAGHKLGKRFGVGVKVVGVEKGDIAPPRCCHPGIACRARACVVLGQHAYTPVAFGRRA